MFFFVSFSDVDKFSESVFPQTTVKEFN